MILGRTKDASIDSHVCLMPSTQAQTATDSKRLVRRAGSPIVRGNYSVLSKLLPLLAALVLCLGIWGCSSPKKLVEVTLEGGTGRATIVSPAEVSTSNNGDIATIEWSSPHYDYMIVDGEQYLPTNTGGNSTFDIPVLAYDEPFEVVADTTAMSTPHEIEYRITFHSK